MEYGRNFCGLLRISELYIKIVCFFRKKNYKSDIVFLYKECHPGLYQNCIVPSAKPKEAVVGTFVTNHQRRSETKVKSKPNVELGTLQG